MGEQAEKKKRPPLVPSMRTRAPPAATRSLSPPRQVTEKEIVEEDALYAEEEKADEIPVEQTQEYKDIEDILNDIKNDTGEKLENLTDIQKKVLECLGLIG